MNSLLILLFRTHDILATFLARHMVVVKRVLLIAAHVSIFGLFFPELRKAFGEQAFNILFFLLFLSPLSKIFRTRLLLILMSYRRQLGIIMAYLATVHGIGYLIDPVWLEGVFGITSISSFWKTDPRYLVGIVAYFLALPLLFTSNDWAMKLLGSKNWKRLHSLVYVVFILATLHKFTVGRGFSDTISVVQAILFIGLYVLLKLWANKGAPNFVLKSGSILGGAGITFFRRKRV